ncbi:hypothetical protein K438DRAFT_1782315 [Mycena galopus ATCC 62051]|nr:hypothetical protein K438DRAFT_1782315 [Mycena galopus ATCC 62051]
MSKRLSSKQKKQREDALSQRTLLPSSAQNLTVETDIITADLPPKHRTKSTIAGLQSIVSGLESSLQASHAQIAHLEAVIADLRTRDATRLATIADLRTQLTSSRAAEAISSAQLSISESDSHSHLDGLQKARKRIKRLENDKKRNLIAKRNNTKAATTVAFHSIRTGCDP